MEAGTGEIQHFDGWVRDERRGGLNDDLTLALQDVVQAVRAVDKPGKLILELSIAPSGSGRKVMVTPTIKTKVPEADPESSIFFVDDAGRLHKDDPFQGKLDFKSVPPEETGKVRQLRPDSDAPRRVEDEEGPES